MSGRRPTRLYTPVSTLRLRRRYFVLARCISVWSRHGKITCGCKAAVLESCSIGGAGRWGQWGCGRLLAKKENIEVEGNLNSSEKRGASAVSSTSARASRVAVQRQQRQLKCDR
ncbi:hypothetical protein TGMAS_465001 [Toxoplasma gondii MAS]|uniref:Uncharacterized protein n=1 Tax=Toxoplasma gondii MAS TaxID=943118 RepID=A0A086PMC0_TOXGO|nr:hypothetical protein TGMAS_465001 [Toxoplasma gondii MAS]